MSTNSKARIAIICYAFTVVMFWILPRSFLNLWVRGSASCFFGLALVALILWLVQRDTIDWSNTRGTIVVFYWDMEEDILWALRKTEDQVSYRQDVRCAFIDIVELRDGSTEDRLSIMMDGIPFEREKSRVVMNEGKYMILKKDDIRLKIQKNRVVENFFAA